MKSFVIFALVGCFSLAIVQCEKSPLQSDASSLLDDILKKITTSILNARTSIKEGFYEIADDRSIHFVHSSTPDADDQTSYTTTTVPDLYDDESVKDFVDGGEEEEGTIWELVPRRVTVHDPLRDDEEFPLVDANEVDGAEDTFKKTSDAILERRRRDVKVDVGGPHGVNVDVNKPGKHVAVNVGGQGGSGSGGVDVAVNKPESNSVDVKVGGIEDFLKQFGIHFNGGKPSGSYGGGAYGGASASGGNVDVNVGGKPGHNGVDVNVNKPNKGNTNVAVDWASFIPFVNVGVNKNKGGSKVDVNVGQNGGAGGLVDVKVNRDEAGNSIEGGKKVSVRAPFVDVNVDGESAHPHAGPTAGDVPSHKKKVVVHAPFVDLNIDGDFPPHPPHPHHPHPHQRPKKHHFKRREHDEDRNVSVNVGGQSNGAWWPFVNVDVNSDKVPHGRAAGRKCIKINVPFVNVLLNRSGCDDQESASADPTPA